MKSLRVWHILLLLLILIAILGFDKLIIIYKLLFAHTQMGWGDFRLIDFYISGLLIILIPLLLFLFRDKNFLSAKAAFLNSGIIIIITSFVFTPLIAPFHFEYHKNINVTKLLPPLSSIDFIHKKELSGNDFERLKTGLLVESHQDNRVYIRGLNKNLNTAYQGKRILELSPDEYIFEGGEVKTGKQFFILGTDEYGRDILSKLLYGGRVSILAGGGGVFISLFLGLLLGFFAAGKRGKWLNMLSDLFLSFPVIFLVILMIVLWGNSLLTLIFVLGLSGWMNLFKIVRGEVIGIKQKDYFITAKKIGLNNFRLLFHEIVPVVIIPVVVASVFQFGNIIIAESALSFLGLGAGKDYSSWGSMIEAGMGYMINGWWIWFFPGVGLVLLLLVVNSVGNRLSSHFNPKLQL
jgi:peptide/nickel transport system permease protein